MGQTLLKRLNRIKFGTRTLNKNLLGALSFASFHPEGEAAEAFQVTTEGPSKHEGL